MHTSSSASEQESSPISFDEFEKQTLDSLENIFKTKNQINNLPRWSTSEHTKNKQIAGLLPLDHISSFMASCNRENAHFNLDYRGEFGKTSRYVNFGAALSGGSDSMSLLLLLNQFIDKHEKWFKEKLNYTPKLVAFHVDHDIRPESSNEAKSIKQYVYKKGIKCQVLKLKWKGETPENKTQAVLRKMRYETLLEACKSTNIHFLFLGHNWNDQIETFFMRMAKASTLTGLAGMKQSWIYQNELFLLRPLLKFDRSRIISTCKENDWKWWEDPSNNDSKYTRNFLRDSLKNADLESTELAKLFQSSLDLNQELEAQIGSTVRVTSRFLWEFGSFVLSRGQFNLLDDNPALQLQSVKWAVKQICRHPNKIRSAQCEKMIQFLKNPATNKLFSIGGCLIHSNRNFFVFVHSTEDVLPQELKFNQTTDFDETWKLLLIPRDENTSKQDDKFFVQYMTPILWAKTKSDETFKKLRYLSRQGIPSPIIRSLIVVTDVEGNIVAVPQVNMALRSFSPNFLIRCAFVGNLNS